ncbi:MAG TPA: LOG family protein [Ktedonobacteraceae bacterium]|nr:LOG family protein [Ktedonobacteraceae bacterium]
MSGNKLEVGVMGSARLTEDDERWVQAHKLGELLAGDGFVVVTGGYGGLMAAVSRGAHEKGGQVIGLPMQHWRGIEPNRWNAGLRWSTDYGTRINHFLHCDAVIALPGGVGTLSEMAMVWAASQTEGRALPLVLLGDCWPPVIQSIREHLVVGDIDLNLLRFATGPEEAVREIQAGLQDTQIGSGPRG